VILTSTPPLRGIAGMPSTTHSFAGFNVASRAAASSCVRTAATEAGA
jgi:hypothetical protein